MTACVYVRAVSVVLSSALALSLLTVRGLADKAKPLLKSARHRSLHIRTRSPLRQQVVVADRLVMVIDAPSGGRTPVQRVNTINERLVDIIATEPLKPSRMCLSSQAGQTVIMVGRHLLTSVTPADAQANQTTIPTLAHFWLANLKRALPQARPQVRVP